MSERVIAIDGPAGSGKSSTARAVASQLELAHLDSGALYRTVTLVALNAGVPLDGRAVVDAVRSRTVTLEARGGHFHPVVAGDDVSHEIRSSRVTRHVSAISALPAVREWTTAALRSAALGHPLGAVVEGRDIGTVVFPDASLKIFLTAGIAERARRRAAEVGREDDAAYLDRVTEDLARRDEADSSRAMSPLRPAHDAVRIDTTELAFEEQVAAVVAKARALPDLA